MVKVLHYMEQQLQIMEYKNQHAGTDLRGHRDPEDLKAVWDLHPTVEEILKIAGGTGGDDSEREILLQHLAKTEEEQDVSSVPTNAYSHGGLGLNLVPPNGYPPYGHHHHDSSGAMMQHNSYLSHAEQYGYPDYHSGADIGLHNEFQWHDSNLPHAADSPSQAFLMGANNIPGVASQGRENAMPTGHVPSGTYHGGLQPAFASNNLNRQTSYHEDAHLASYSNQLFPSDPNQVEQLHREALASNSNPSASDLHQPGQRPQVWNNGPACFSNLTSPVPTLMPQPGPLLHSARLSDENRGRSPSASHSRAPTSRLPDSHDERNEWHQRDEALQKLADLWQRYPEKDLTSELRLLLEYAWDTLTHEARLAVQALLERSITETVVPHGPYKPDIDHMFEVVRPLQTEQIWTTPIPADVFREKCNQVGSLIGKDSTKMRGWKSHLRKVFSWNNTTPRQSVAVLHYMNKKLKMMNQADTNTARSKRGHRLPTTLNAIWNLRRLHHSAYGVGSSGEPSNRNFDGVEYGQQHHAMQSQTAVFSNPNVANASFPGSPGTNSDLLGALGTNPYENSAYGYHDSCPDPNIGLHNVSQWHDPGSSHAAYPLAQAYPMGPNGSQSGAPHGWEYTMPTPHVPSGTHYGGFQPAFVSNNLNPQTPYGEDAPFASYSNHLSHADPNQVAQLPGGASASAPNHFTPVPRPTGQRPQVRTPVTISASADDPNLASSGGGLPTRGPQSGPPPLLAKGSWKPKRKRDDTYAQHPPSASRYLQNPH
ncbi:uncharacterized protein JCM15063_004095 [Sporobolomyces koalae]|uniref:uncharacterized protein n=1 Tax=Sporobolomyces koalae TaxID=500713 RepID=UPI003171DE00